MDISCNIKATHQRKITFFIFFNSKSHSNYKLAIFFITFNLLFSMLTAMFAFFVFLYNIIEECNRPRKNMFCAGAVHGELDTIDKWCE